MSKKLLVLLSISLLVLSGCSKQEQAEISDIITEEITDSVSIEEEPTEGISANDSMDESSQETPVEEESSEGEAMEDKFEEAQPAEEAESTPEVSEEPIKETPQEDKQEEVVSSASYLAYSQGAEATMSGKQKAIFFHALWCPTCRALDGEINSRLSELPGNTVIFKADYDKDTDLRQKYGVQLQHTVVFVDDAGNETSRLQGANFEALLGAL